MLDFGTFDFPRWDTNKIFGAKSESYFPQENIKIVTNASLMVMLLVLLLDQSSFAFTLVRFPQAFGF